MAAMAAMRGGAAGVALGLVVMGCGAASSLPGGGSGGSGGGGGSGPSGDPLVGTWVGSLSGDGEDATETFTVDADGTAIETTAITQLGSASCSGSIQLTGVAWSATATTITLSGGACTGGVSCSSESVSCLSLMANMATCTYALSDGDSTLVLDCGGQSVTFTRQG